MNYIVIEDFGTTGLTGDPEQTTDNGGNHFYYFFRNVGRSAKEQDKGGSWGLGKWVFPDASKLNAFFALTHRDDGDTLFMGQAVLKQHTIASVKYDPYGFFSQTKLDDTKLQIPFNSVENPTIIDNFRSDFNLQRNGEPGLSIVIPFTSDRGEENETFHAEDILRSVIKFYFYPIVAGNLIVEISENDSKWELNNENIEEIISQVNWPKDPELNREDLVKLIDMSMDNLTLEENKWIELKNNPRQSVEDMIGSNKEKLVNNYRLGERLYLKIPIIVRKKKEKNGKTSYLTVIVQKDESVDQGKDYYVRGNLAIQGIDTVKAYPVRAFIHIKENEPLAHLLRDTEEPSHSNWKIGSTRAELKYVNVNKTVRFVKNSVRRILSILSKTRENIQKDAFIDIFYIEKEQIVSGGKKSGDDEPKPNGDPPPFPHLENPELFQIARTSSGFTVSASSGKEFPQSIEIYLAYESKGNPLSKYSPHDFQLQKSPINLEFEECNCEADNNHLLISDINDKFKVTITGFDINRDIYIKAEAIDSGENRDD